MKNHTLNKLLGIIGSSIIAFATGLAAETPKAQAAVLTYNFTANTTGWTTGTYTGYFKFDNSSLTGIGEEIVGISEGVFNFVGADGQPSSYGLRSPISRKFNNRNTFLGEGIMSSVDIEAYILNGDFLGLSVGRFGLSSVSGVSRFIDEGLRQFTTSDVLYMTFNPYTDVIDGYLSVPRNRLFSEKIPYQGTVTYSGPVRPFGEIVAEPVPEPMTVAGTALALAGFAALKRQKNRQHLS